MYIYPNMSCGHYHFLYTIIKVLKTLIGGEDEQTIYGGGEKSDFDVQKCVINERSRCTILFSNLSISLRCCSISSGVENFFRPPRFGIFTLKYLSLLYLKWL